MKRYGIGKNKPSPWARYRIAVCTPAMDLCHTRFADSLVKLWGHTLMSAPGLGIVWLSFGTSILPFSRNVLAAQALERDATHVLWIDSDMAFPPDTLLRLLQHRLPIVGANCISRRPPFALTARMGEEQVETREDSTGLQKVDRVGTGVLLVATDVFRKLEMPWFECVWLPERSVFRGEDFVFCGKASAAGFEIHIDHDVSKQVEHIGQFGLNPLMKAHMPDQETS